MIKLVNIRKFNRIGSKNFLSVCLLNKIEHRSVATVKDGPLKALAQKIESKELLLDEHQQIVMKDLQRIYDQLQNYQPPDTEGASSPGFLSKLFGSQPKLDPSKRMQGLYIYGSVGGGKTMLMDMFYDCCTQISKKKRAHFNSFMTEVHKEIHSIKQKQTRDSSSTFSEKPRPFDPIAPVAEIIKEEAYLICFDEFQVTDIADAMILKRLFTKLFDYGVVVVATSNRKPDDLYKNGLQRSNFIPFIPILKNHCNVLQLDSGIDYRSINKGQGEHYFLDTEPETNSRVDAIFKVLCSQENDVVRPKTFTHFGRNITFEKTCGQVLDTTFEELCNRNFAASDYLQLAQYFHTIIIRHVPQLNLKKKSATRRFITLIDSLYDNRIRVVISADAPLEYLFSEEKPSDLYVSDEHRALMDDLKLSKDSADLAANIFTGEEEMFAFDRTRSRLTEMQTADYWQMWAKYQ